MIAKNILTLFGPGYFGVGKDRGDSPALISHEVVMVSPRNFQDLKSSLFQTGNNHFHAQIL